MIALSSLYDEGIFFLKISLKTFMKTMEELGLLIKDIKLAKIINWKTLVGILMRIEDSEDGDT